MGKAQERIQAKTRIHARIRRKVKGTAERPRLAVSRTLRWISVQVIDDAAGTTLAHATSREEGVRGNAKSAANKTAAVQVGALIAERARAKGIQAVVFDRGGHLYHGNVKALAEAAREKGLKF
ncbi:MAG TPA: 50S ribosomal protein L18 [Thermoanaerobaculia bacterium]|nr:50S ribosomal protein L18 [Thermoanaerobaculia bacterium]